MEILQMLLENLPDARVLDVRVGLHRTAVVVERAGKRNCGLGSTLTGPVYDHGYPLVPLAGKMTGISALELANYAISEQPTMASIGMAALNALVDPPQNWFEANAAEIMAEKGDGKHVALIGHFPFVDDLRSRVGKLSVLELNPQPGDEPASAAPRILPTTDVVAITGMTLINHTLSGLLELCSEKAYIMLLGPSVPLSPLLFDHGIDVVSGSIVTDIEAVLTTISQGGNFRQLHKAGVRLVNIRR